MLKTNLTTTTIYFLTLVSCGQPSKHDDQQLKQKESLVVKKNLDIVVYELGIPPRDTFDIFPQTTVEFALDSIKPTFIKFASGGTETNIAIIDSIDASTYKSIWDCRPVKRLDFGHSENGLLDISDLHRGVYFIRYSSCNIGGNYKLILTK